MLNHNLYNYMYAHSYSHPSNCCRNELIQKLHNFVHLNLCIALSLGLLLFLTGIQTATANIVSDRQTIGMYIVYKYAQLYNGQGVIIHC